MSNGVSVPIDTRVHVPKRETSGTWVHKAMFFQVRVRSPEVGKWKAADHTAKMDFAPVSSLSVPWVG